MNEGINTCIRAPARSVARVSYTEGENTAAEENGPGEIAEIDICWLAGIEWHIAQLARARPTMGRRVGAGC